MTLFRLNKKPRLGELKHVTRFCLLPRITAEREIVWLEKVELIKEWTCAFSDDGPWPMWYTIKVSCLTQQENGGKDEI